MEFYVSPKLARRTYSFECSQDILGAPDPLHGKRTKPDRNTILSRKGTIIPGLINEKKTGAKMHPNGTTGWHPGQWTMSLFIEGEGGDITAGGELYSEFIFEGFSLKGFHMR